MNTRIFYCSSERKKGLSQEQLAEQVFVTRQPERRRQIRKLKLLSTFYDVSINTLLGAPRQLVCQCCGMPLDDDHQP